MNCLLRQRSSQKQTTFCSMTSSARFPGHHPPPQCITVLPLRTGANTVRRVRCPCLQILTDMRRQKQSYVVGSITVARRGAGGGDSNTNAAGRVAMDRVESRCAARTRIRRCQPDHRARCGARLCPHRCAAPFPFRLRSNSPRRPTILSRWQPLRLRKAQT